MVAAVEGCEPRARVDETDRTPRRVVAVARDTWSIVGHRDGQARAGSRRAQADPAGAGTRTDAMADGVLDERLQQERRDTRLERIIVDVDIDDQPILESVRSIDR